MEYCFICAEPETKALLFDVVAMNGVRKICGKCSSKEGLPLVRDESENFEIPSTRERLIDIHKKENSWERKTFEKPFEGENKNRNEVAINPNTDLNDELIDNFHWIVMRGRRTKHLTHEQLAEVLGVQPEVIKNIEKGRFPPRRDLLRKMQSYLGILIMKKPGFVRNKEVRRDFHKGKEFDLDPEKVENLTIADLQEMKLRKKMQDELDKNFEQDRKEPY
ncbi:MAG: helix-turn-helix domain-containing protein [Candidatus Pacearchaeota archaeon]